MPIFLSLTSGRSAATSRRAAWQAVGVSFLVITCFAFFGQQILSYLHISLPALQAAGGLLLLLVALELLTGKEDSMGGSTGGNVALVPLGTPLLAGPGAIVATMLFVERVDDSATFLAVGLGIVGVHLCLWAAMRFSLPILRLIRESGVLLVTRIAGLLLLRDRRPAGRRRRPGVHRRGERGRERRGRGPAPLPARGSGSAAAPSSAPAGRRS